ncbi:T9SS type A sorting domain-containing protein [Rubrivirga sp.]|uniref:T9SS type A sorting domain-containing protein n=1 Tax=Rubrivirga sp. TaxID=1885344 RepID=UPI003C77BBA5
MNKLAVATALLALTSLAHAQEEPNVWRDFLPLEVGDEWVYNESGSDTQHRQLGGATTRFSRVSRYRVVRDTVVDGNPVHVVSGPGGESVFGGATDGSRWIVEQLTTIDRLLPSVPMFLSFNGGVPLVERFTERTESIGGISYTVRASPQCCFAMIAEGIGLIRLDRSWTGIGGSGGSRSVRLVYASVGGREWGRDPLRPVSSEDGPAARTPLSVSPNPVTDGVRINLGTESAATVHVEVVDVTGRTVASTTMRGGENHYLALPDLSPGTYVVRARSSEGHFGSVAISKAGR